MVFLFFPIVSLWRLDDGPERWLGLVALTVFIPLYISSFTHLGAFLDVRGRKTQLVRAALIVIIIAVLAWSIRIDVISMFPFLVGFTSYGLWPPIRLPATLAVIGVSVAVVIWQGMPAVYFTPVIITVLLVVASMLTVRVIEYEVAAAESEQHLRAAEERERLARDVHDLVGHSITVATLRLQLAERLFDSDPDRARAELARTREFLQETHGELRRSITGQQERSLVNEVDRVVDALHSSGVQVDVKGSPEVVRGPVALVLGWVLREAATNVLRHANARRVRICFEPHGFSMIDDGDGPGQGKGSGIPGMRQRVAASGGDGRLRGEGDVVIRVLLADDQDLIRGALAALLELEPDIDVVAQVGRGDEVLAAAREARAEACLIDIQMPGVDGIEAARQLRDQLPGVRVVMVTTFDRPGYLRRSLEAGAIGFVVKNTPAAELAEIVRRAHAGLRTIDRELAHDVLFTLPNPLTTREQEVLQLAASGEPVAQLARKLFLSQGTVRNHLSNAIGKTGAANRMEAVRIATERGWL